MDAGFLYEINTRCWLRELSLKHGVRLTLADVPDEEFEIWRSTGFTHVWLMGVWQTGPLATASARSDKSLAGSCAELVPDLSPGDIGASPYAISGYQVLSELGGERGLQAFRRKLHQYGLKLILDFIPNHVGLDHPWIAGRPGLFVPGAAGRPGCFQALSHGTSLWLAHGRDPYFPPWNDTAQLDYRFEGARVAMASELHNVARLCDGIRCDMAMLVLRDVFCRTWADFPRSCGQWPTEFWESAINSIRQSHPGFLFIAEAYWGLEPELCRLGFDVAYDKVTCDEILSCQYAAVCRRLYQKPAKDLSAGLYFLENHDERRVASVLSLEDHRVAALLLLSLPGMTLLHEGQLSGKKLRVPVQLLRRPTEVEDSGVRLMYQDLLRTVRESRIRRGRHTLVTPEQKGEQSCASVMLVQWKDLAGSDLVAINLGNESCRFVAHTNAVTASHAGVVRAATSGARFAALKPGELELELPGRGFSILSFGGAGL